MGEPIDYRSYSLSLREWMKYGSLGLALAGGIAWLFYRDCLAMILLSPLVIIVPLLMRRSLCEKRKQELAGQFRDGATTLASFLSSGYSVENAFAYSAREMAAIYGEEGLITQEFRRITHQIELNCTVEDGIRDLARRSGLSEIEQFAEVFLAAKRSSGDLNRVLNDTADLLARKISLREEIRTLVAAKMLEQNIMNLMPAGILLYTNLMNEGYTDVLYGSMAGHLIMTLILLIYGGAILWGRKILEIPV